VRVLGVDPGTTGALAMLDTELAALVVADMPIAVIEVGKMKRRQISEFWLADLLRLYEPDCAWIERVHALPKQGVTSSFSFGLSYGLVRGVLAALSVPVSLVTPQEWKKSFRLGASKMRRASSPPDCSLLTAAALPAPRMTAGPRRRCWRCSAPNEHDVCVVFLS
jgi:crossover junction endodeoxyribonuclease RuvC